MFYAYKVSTRVITSNKARQNPLLGFILVGGFLLYNTIVDFLHSRIHGLIAQLVEHRICNAKVQGSIPCGASMRDTNKLKSPFREGIELLIKLANEQGIPAFVTDTTRTLAEQKELVRKGYSKTLNSKHLTGEAADIAFQINGKLSYDARLYDRLYIISKTIPYVIWPYKDLGWNWDKPHHQYDKNKKTRYNTDMKELVKCKEETRKLNTEIGRVTKERDNAREALGKEIASHIETLEKLQAEFKKRTDAEDKLRKCKSGSSILDKIKALLAK